ncbi:MAG: MerR family transcriptional regulator [Chloroflexota bacterium]
MTIDSDEPRYVISIAAKMLGVQVHTLRYYERLGIIEPSRSQGRVRLYTDRDIAILRQVKSLMEDLGVNLVGAEVILRMGQRMTEMQRELEGLRSEVARKGGKKR